MENIRKSINDKPELEETEEKILADCGFEYSEIIRLSNMQVGIMGIK